jgi:hypothetical protein
MEYSRIRRKTKMEPIVYWIAFVFILFFASYIDVERKK